MSNYNFQNVYGTGPASPLVGTPNIIARAYADYGLNTEQAAAPEVAVKQESDPASAPQSLGTTAIESV